ncbi:unannotated protein [freshwater metagenome]|uniref:Unannotated protein n=1 Tax=freshwater metagenome TaxID=449393 RepID=A0A6J6FZD6_9ZZZZ|nr:hypothetical protein [Actinomycetota bacterium]
MKPDLVGSQTALRNRIHEVLLTISLLLLLLADVLAFNQLATQSATDAILQVIVFAVGGAGFFEFLRRTLCSTTTRGRWSGIIPGAMSAAALIAWRTNAPLGWLVIITIASAAFLAVIAFRSLGGSGSAESSESTQIIGLLCLAQTIVLLYVAALATIDGSSVLFA